MTVKTLKKYLKESGFEIVEAEKFMCWPWGFLGEILIERIMKRCGLSFLPLNQLVVGRRSS
ncbi:MAG: hypothetical protein KAS32_08840 [Candidatus Peribacteraceae bacterium]|nr:hypothetical protein [Candidatus Peribacteraceae bacterium]